VRVYTFERGALGRPSLARIREGLDQDLEALGRLRMAGGGMKPRQSWVGQDVYAAILRGLRGDPVGLGVHAELPDEGGRLRPVRGLIYEGR
jgi:hypothetical protein